MKVRETIKINRTLTLEELYEFMQQHWDTAIYNDFIIGKPAHGAFRDYILLPATPRCVISVYPKKDKVVVAVTINPKGQIRLMGSFLIGGAVGGVGSIGMNGEMYEVASQANGLYAAYLESLFAKHGLLTGSPERKCPIIKGSEGEKTVGNVLELVKIAPAESRGKSLLSLILGFISIVLFITGIPGAAVGAAAIITANSVLKRRGYQFMAYIGRILGKIGVGMSLVAAVIYLVGYL